MYITRTRSVGRCRRSGRSNSGRVRVNVSFRLVPFSLCMSVSIACLSKELLPKIVGSLGNLFPK